MSRLNDQSIKKSSKALWLLLLVIIIWGINVPVIKFTLDTISPLWLCTIRFVLATACMFMYAILSKTLILPSRQDIPIIISVAIFYMTLANALVTVGLTDVNAGRAIILEYTTPIWVTPFALLVFKEQLTRNKFFGLVLGILGIIVLFNPSSFDWNNSDVVIGNGLLLLSALIWTVAILHIQVAKPTHSTAQLLPWQLLLTTLLTAGLTFVLEPRIIIHWVQHSIMIIIYLSLIGTLFSYWAAIEANKTLSAITISVGLLGAPVVGFIASIIFLGEPLTWHLGIALVLIIAALLFTALGETRQ